MTTTRMRQWNAERAARIVHIEHAKAFSDLAHAVYDSVPPPGGWPAAVQEHLDTCREVSTRMRDAVHTFDRLRNRG